MKGLPRRIEAYDAAHLQTSFYVGAMAVAENGSLKSDQYRKFKIRDEKGSDTSALKEMVERRLKHTDWSKPDLMLLDGGVAQLSTVFPLVPEEIALIALSKKKETLHYYDKDGKLTNLNLAMSSPVLSFLRMIRDESHRLANSYHQESKRKSYL